MTPGAVAAVAGFMALGGAVGWAAVPAAADALLRRAYRRSVGWWWESHGEYLAFRSAHPGVEPSPRACGAEGALGLWRKDAVQAARAGLLAYERACALAEAVVDVDPSHCKRTEADQERRCTFKARPAHRAACAAGCAAAFAAAAASGVPWAVAALFGACAACMAVGVACDVKARMLPLECCLALALAGAAFQVLAAGFAGLAVGAGCAVLVVAVCSVANCLAGRAGPVPVGHGDVRCMVALSLASGAGAPMGIAACYGGAALFSAAGMAMGRLSAKDGIPMAPFLSAWLVLGAGAAALG